MSMDSRSPGPPLKPPLARGAAELPQTTVAAPYDSSKRACYEYVHVGTRRTNSLTGQSFIAARVRVAGFEVNVCLLGGMEAVLADLAPPSIGERPWRRRRLGLPLQRSPLLPESDRRECRGCGNGHARSLSIVSWSHRAMGTGVEPWAIR